MKTVFPLAIDLYKELEKAKKYPKKLVIDERIDIYSEAIALKVIHNYNANLKENTLPLHCYVILLIKHPYLISLLQCNRTRSEWIEFRKQLLTECISMFGENHPSIEVNNFKEFMSSPITDKVDKMSSIHMFHYFVGFNFKQGSVGIDADELPKDDSVSFFVVNLSYNLKNKDSLIIYKSVIKVREKLLNIKTIDNFSPYIKSPITPSKVPFIKLDKDLKPISTLTDKVYILLCYNDAPTYENCHYTIAHHGENGYVDKKFINSFIAGSMPKILDDADITLYMETMFFKKINDEPEPIKSLKEDYIMFLNVIRDAFNKSTQETIVDNIMSDPNINLVFDKTEIPFLKVYLSKLKSLEVYDLGNVVSYALAYIYPDLFGSIGDFNNT